MDIVSIVREAYINATEENGYVLDDMSSEDVACDMVECGVFDLNEVDVQVVEEAIRRFRGF